MKTLVLLDRTAADLTLPASNSPENSQINNKKADQTMPMKLRSRTSAQFIARLLALPLCTLSLAAQTQVPLVRSGVSADASGLQAIVAQFRDDLGQTSPPIAGLR